jgi:hypothetical protein
MTRDIYDKATVSLDKTLQLQAVRDKIKRELPELLNNKQLKEWVGDDLFSMLEMRIKLTADEFGKL